MDATRLEHVTIVGGGTAGWMTALALARVLGHQVKVTLVESPAIATVGVGEATIPPIKLFNQLAGFEEAEFLRETKASLKLGIEFQGWGRADSRYRHLFGTAGQQLRLGEFFQYWLRGRDEGVANDFGRYSLTGAAADAGKAAPVGAIKGSRLEGITYAYHFDAGLFAAYCRSKAEALGVTRIEGTICGVERDGESGFITALRLDDDRLVGGEFFIDCSGFRALLIGEEMGSEFIDWSHWLACDRAVAVPCANGPRLRPYTQSLASEAGWRWRIPLQHRTGNGHVFCSARMSEEEATRQLLEGLEGEALGEPRVVRFRTGMRREFWKGNVAALGLSSGFLEPLESTSIHLVQAGITKLMSHWPASDFAPALVAEYNRRMTFEYESVRDFIIAHYHLNSRPEPFWQAAAAMDVPDALRRRIELFEASGKIFRDEDELFTEIGWFQVLTGQGVAPRTWHPLADKLSSQQLGQFLGDIETLVTRAAAQLPAHEDYLRSVGAEVMLEKELQS